MTCYLYSCAMLILVIVVLSILAVSIGYNKLFFLKSLQGARRAPDVLV